MVSVDQIAFADIDVQVTLSALRFWPTMQVMDSQVPEKVCGLLLKKTSCCLLSFRSIYVRKKPKRGVEFLAGPQAQQPPDLLWDDALIFGEYGEAWYFCGFSVDNYNTATIIASSWHANLFTQMAYRMSLLIRMRRGVDALATFV